jgi:hypothetical protein
VAQPQPGVAPYALDVEARVQGRDALLAGGPGAQPSGGGVARWRTSLQGPATFELALPEHCCGA